jgi:hypothetical protein
MKGSDLTVHDFRSSFRDWASGCTGFPFEGAEMALAHAVDDKVEAAYRCGDLFQKRRQLAEGPKHGRGIVDDPSRTVRSLPYSSQQGKADEPDAVDPLRDDAAFLHDVVKLPHTNIDNRASARWPHPRRLAVRADPSPENPPAPISYRTGARIAQRVVFGGDYEDGRRVPSSELSSACARPDRPSRL